MGLQFPWLSLPNRPAPMAGFALACSLVGGLTAAVAAPVFDLSFSAPAQPTAVRAEPLTSFRFAIGPFALGSIATLLAEGPLQQTAFKINAPGQSTLQLMQPLRDQITAAGFTVIYECETQICGGFDFRYGTDVMAEPEMHIDLGDFRYLAATRNRAAQEDTLSLIVSRSPDHGFVQLTQVGGFAIAEPKLTESTKTPALVANPPAVAAPVEPAKPIAAPSELGAMLDQGLPLVLEDLVFPSGSSALAKGDYGSLRALAAWLRANPEKTAMVVGHTDATGGVAANLSLSKLRAQSVRQRLLAEFDIPAVQIAAEGAGSLSPRDTNATDLGRQKNRRVEVIITSTP